MYASRKSPSFRAAAREAASAASVRNAGMNMPLVFFMNSASPAESEPSVTLPDFQPNTATSGVPSARAARAAPMSLPAASVTRTGVSAMCDAGSRTPA